MKKSMIWFCRTSDSSSLARITDSVVPLLKQNFDITLLSNETNITGIKHVDMGADTECIKYVDFLRTMPGAFKNGKISEDNIRCINMKFIMVQLVELIYDGDYEYLLICNGVYEIDWITKVLTSNPKYLINKCSKKTKLVVWSPIDYIPSLGVIQNVTKADKFITMTPVMKDEITSLIADIPNSCEIDWVGHGSDIASSFDNIKSMTRKQIVEELSKIPKGTIFVKNAIKESDIIILNANNYGPLDPKLDSVVNTPGTRKRLDLTIKSFLKVLEQIDNKFVIKLWIHTNLKSFFEMLAIENIPFSEISENVIISNNKITNDQLGMIYQLSNISLQTSFGEGWSLTNLEAALYKSLQVVPDFLACGYHFKDRGILIPVSRKIIKNEGGIDVIIGEVSIEDTTAKLLEAIELYTDNFRTNELNTILNDAYDYSNSHTWESVANKLLQILN
jgi:glycosyltransferase involved in cell wall biosynthesis